MPATATRVGRSRYHTKAISAIQIGETLSSSEARPVGKNCTVQAIMPLPKQQQRRRR